MNHINEKDPWHSDPNKKLRKSWRQAKRLQNPGKKYLFIDPEGRKYRLDSDIQSIPSFCKRHNIASSHMYSCAKGTKLQHKGWKARLII